MSTHPPRPADVPLTPDDVIALVYDAFARRDLARLGNLLATEVTFVSAAGVGARAQRGGRQALLEEISRTVNATNGTAAATLEATYACADGRRLCVQHETARFRRIEVDRRALLLVTIRRERIARVEWLRLVGGCVPLAAVPLRGIT